VQVPCKCWAVCMPFAGDKAAGRMWQHAHLQSLPRAEEQPQPLARLLGLHGAGAMPFSCGRRKFAGDVLPHQKELAHQLPQFRSLFTPGQVSSAPRRGGSAARLQPPPSGATSVLLEWKTTSLSLAFFPFFFFLYPERKSCLCQKLILLKMLMLGDRPAGPQTAPVVKHVLGFKA